MSSTRCERCKRECDVGAVIVVMKNGNGPFIFCPECADFMGHCQMCKQGIQCGFFNDPDPMPQMVMARREERGPMGIMIVETQTPNPARVQKFCVDAKCPCLCWPEGQKPFCCKFTEYTTCTNYDMLDFGKIVEDFSTNKASEN